MTELIVYTPTQRYVQFLKINNNDAQRRGVCLFVRWISERSKELALFCLLPLGETE